MHRTANLQPTLGMELAGWHSQQAVQALGESPDASSVRRPVTQPNQNGKLPDKRQGTHGRPGPGRTGTPGAAHPPQATCKEPGSTHSPSWGRIALPHRPCSLPSSDGPYEVSDKWTARNTHQLSYRDIKFTAPLELSWYN
ncbi:Hypothetical predicted protein [Pelobates cultripes]|uniref:Uncharacterized protein n=1 Tax=Pelobates cultripes TaxID=61616 RepID=A0AAD1RP46_PELCU|nr:Hypothetical predicted protein [Pelobates cultripes]